VIEAGERAGTRILADQTSRWAVVAVVAVAIASTRGLTLPPTLIITIAGVAMWWIGRNAPPSRLDTPPESASPGGIAVWATLFVLFCLWELAVFLLGNNHDFPTFSMLVDPIVTWPPTRAAATAGWLAWGWYLLRR
jgi:hypothetical protein